MDRTPAWAAPKNAGRRAHGVSTVEFHPCGRTSHGRRGVATEHRIAVSGHGQWTVEWPEIRGGIVIADSCDPDVFRHHGFAFFLELLGENLLQRLETNAHHAETGAHCERVLGHLITCDVSQLGDGERAELHARRGDTRLDRVRVVEACSAVGKQTKVAIHRVLVQRDQQIQAVTHVGDFLWTSADRKKRVPTANDRLIGVVSIQVQAAAAEDFREDVARCCDALTSGAPDGNGEGLLHSTLLPGIGSGNVAFQLLNGFRLTGDNPLHQVAD